MKQKTLQIFIELLEAFANQESSLEYSRQLLANHTEFEPYAVFQRLDFSHKGFLTPDDIYQFLLENGLSQTEKSCALFLKQFDFDTDQKLVYTEFLRIVLPTNNPALRTIVSQRPTYFQKKLAFDVEFGMSRLINKEIQGLNHLESLKKDLFFNTSDFDLKEAFFKIDNRNSGFISFDNLEEFLENKGCYLSHEQIINLLKRLDRNDDGKVNFEELKFSLLPNDGAVPAKTSALMSVTRHYENDFYDIYEPKQQVYEDYLKNELARNSKKNEKSVGFLDRKENSQHEEKKCRKDDNNPKYCRKHARPKQDLTQMYFKEQGELARTLKQFILLDKELEVMKKDLCIREDFELLTTFQIMDVKGKTVLSAYELEQALKKLEIYPSKYELFLFVKRYDKDSDGKFSYSDYIESMVPVELRNIVQKRKPVQENFNFNDFSQVFEKETLRLLRETWILHLENEAAAEALRQRLDSRKNFNIEKIFYTIDYDYDGFLNDIDLMKFMENHGIECNSREIEAIINRFDLNFDQKISYTEFLQEMTPKSPKKF